MNRIKKIDLVVFIYHKVKYCLLYLAHVFMCDIPQPIQLNITEKKE